MFSAWVTFTRLLLSVVLSGIIGLERESLNRPAGFRTHILVCIGSALTMLVSQEIYFMYKGLVAVDPGRIAAQVISGIGFLGAGTIIREGAAVKGLTTAASLWAVAGIGLAVGAGMYTAAVISTGLVFLTLISLGRLEYWLVQKRQFHILNITIADRPGQIGKIGTLFGEFGVSIKNIELHHESDDDTIIVRMVIHLPHHLALATLVERLGQLEGVFAVQQDT